MLTQNQRRILFVIFLTIPLISGLIYWLAFFPGILSYDSIFQWDELSRFQFSNWHPALHTIIFWFLTRFWHSPAIMSLFQIIVFSVVIAYGLITFLDFGLPAPLLIVLDMIISIVPLNGMMQITIWKDVIYSISILLLSIFLLKIIHSKGEWVSLGRNWIYLGFAVACVTLFRHNGFPVAYGTLLMLWIGFRQKQWFYYAFISSLIFTVVVIGPLYKALRVNRSASQPVGIVFIHPIAAHVRAGASFTVDEAAFLNSILPIRQGWPYSCYDATVLLYEGLNFNPVGENPLYAAGILGRLTLNSPIVSLKHFYCLSSFIWDPIQPAGVPLETVYTYNELTSVNPEWLVYASEVTQKPKLPVVRELIIKVMDSYTQLDPGKILWRPAVYLYVYIFAVLLYVYRRKDKLFLFLLAPPLYQSLVIAVTTQLQAVRYQYPVYLISMLFTVPLVYLALFAQAPRKS